MHPVEGSEGTTPRWLVLFDEQVEPGLRPTEAVDADSAVYVSAMQRMEDETRLLKAHLQETLTARRSATKR